VRLARLTGKLVEQRGNAPRATILQGSSAPLCLPLVPRRGFEPRSLRLLRSAFTRLAYEANWCGRGESNSDLGSGAPALCLRACVRLLGGQGPSRTATDYAGRLQRLGLANAQPALLVGSGPASRTLPSVAYEATWAPGLPAQNGGWLRVRTPYLSVSVPVFKTGCRPLQRSHPLLVVPRGFEPRSSGVGDQRSAPMS
jgi:hypothetical protein